MRRWKLSWVALGSVIAVVLLGGCDCYECGGMRIEVVDADTGESIDDAEVVIATSIYGPRHRVNDELGPGEYWIWTRAPGYRRDLGTVEVESVCVGYDEDCPPKPMYTIALEHR